MVQVYIINKHNMSLMSTNSLMFSSSQPNTRTSYIYKRFKSTKLNKFGYINWTSLVTYGYFNNWGLFPNKFFFYKKRVKFKKILEKNFSKLVCKRATSRWFFGILFKTVRCTLVTIKVVFEQNQVTQNKSFCISFWPR